MTRRGAAMFVTLLLVFAGCSTLGYKFQTPKLSIVRVELVKGDLLQQNLRVRLHVSNPNRVALPVRSLSYEIEVAGERFGHGASEQSFVVPASGDAEFDVTVTTNAAGALVKVLAAGLHGDGLEYRLSGKVNLESGLLRSLPFEQSGLVKLR